MLKNFNYKGAGIALIFVTIGFLILWQVARAGTKDLAPYHNQEIKLSSSDSSELKSMSKAFIETTGNFGAKKETPKVDLIGYIVYESALPTNDKEDERAKEFFSAYYKSRQKAYEEAEISSYSELHSNKNFSIRAEEGQLTTFETSKVKIGKTRGYVSGQKLVGEAQFSFTSTEITRVTNRVGDKVTLWETENTVPVEGVLKFIQVGENEEWIVHSIDMNYPYTLAVWNKQGDFSKIRREGEVTSEEVYDISEIPNPADE